MCGIAISLIEDVRIHFVMKFPILMKYQTPCDDDEKLGWENRHKSI